MTEKTETHPPLQFDLFLCLDNLNQRSFNFSKSIYNCVIFELVGVVYTYDLGRIVRRPGAVVSVGYGP